MMALWVMGWEKFDRAFGGGSERRWVWWSAVIVLLIVGVYYVGIKGSQRSALNRWRPQVVELTRGEDIYLRFGFPTPPVMALILVPVCLLPGSWAMLAWFSTKAVLTIWVAARMVSRVDSWGSRLPARVLALALLLAARPVFGDLLHGNVNLWVMALVVGAILAFQDEHDWLAGLLLSAAVACKLTPALLIVYFAWKRQVLVVLTSLAGLFIWWWLVPGLVLGFERNAELFRHWADYMVLPYVQQGAVETSQTNQSAVALVYRVVGFLSRETDSARVASLVVVAGCLGAVGWLCRRRWPSPSSAGWWHEIGIVLLVMLLISERSWKHHFVWLLPISIVLSATAYHLAVEGRRASSRWMVGCMVLAFVLMLLTSQDVARPWMGEAGAKGMQALGAYVWAALALIVAHAIALRELARLPNQDFFRSNLPPMPTRLGARSSRPAAAEAVG